MVKTFEYSNYHLVRLKKKLHNLYDQGKPVEFEIKVDEEIVVCRTSDLEKFFWHINFVTDESKEVVFVLYKGKSRRYDKYIMVRKGVVSPNPNMTTQEFIDGKVMEALNIRNQQMKLASLKQKTKSQKKTIKMLRATLDELQTKKNGDIRSVLELLKSQFIPQSDKSVNGVPSEELAKMIDHYRTQFGEEIFSEALGIALQVAQHPTIIPAVKEFINDKISTNESKEA